MRVAASHVGLLVLLLASTAAHAQRLTYRGFERLPERQAQGLSGITHVGDGAYWGVLEREAKLVQIQIATRDDATIASVKLGEAVRLAKGSDIEGVAWTPSRPDMAMISTESPDVAEVSLQTGRRIAALRLPPPMEKIVQNQGLESLTYAADGKTLWTANERALVIDGNPQVPATPFLSATRVRLARFDLIGQSFEPAGQFEYQTGGVHGAGGQIGLCDLAVLPDGRLLSLERSAAKGLSGNKSIRTRIYLVDVTGATDVSQPPYDAGLVNQTPVKVSKTPLYDGFVCDADGENLEGLCLGPPLGRERWAVIGVVDNTDGGLGVSKPALVSFELDLKAPPTTLPASQPVTAPVSNVSGAKHSG